MKTKLSFFTILCFTLMVSAQNTFVPDDNFEQALINLGYDSGALDDFVPTANINTLTFLNVANKNIADLTGIQDFVALTSLSCSSNQLTSLDVSTNIALIDLICSSNLLTSLNISTNTDLVYLNCGLNQLANLNLNANINLGFLLCYGNQLTNVDLSDNIALTHVEFYNNQLTSLDVSNNTGLTLLECSSNQLTNLDVSANSALTYLNLNTNQLTSLNVKNGNNNNILASGFNAVNNPDLSCIEVDDVTFATANWTNIDGGVSFSTGCGTLGTENFSLLDFQYYPNPVKNTFTLKSSELIEEVTVFNLMGQQVLQIIPNSNEKVIDMNTLNTSAYFVKVKIHNTIKTFKIIKQ